MKKNLKNGIMTVSTFFIMFLLVVNIPFTSVKATTTNNNWITLDEVSNVSINKEFVVTFSGEVQNDKIDGIVIEKDNTYIPVEIKKLDTNKIKITPVNNYDFNSRYCIKIFLSNGKKYCKYFNTVSSTVSNQTENLLNKTNTCASLKEGDKYPIELSEDGKINITFNHNKLVGETDTVWDIRVTDEDETTTVKEIYVNGIEDKTVVPLGLKKGKYNVIVEPYLRENYSYYVGNPDYYSTYVLKVPYSISVDFTGSEYFEQEPDDDMVSAQVINLNQQYTGYSSSLTDDDYYEVQVNEDGYVNVNFSHDKFVGETDGDWKITVMDESKNEFMTLISTGMDANINRYLGLSKDNYYIKVEPYLREDYSYYVGNPQYYSKNVVDSPYSLTVNYIKSDNYEKEFNDSLDKATNINLNEMYMGNSNMLTDNDYYSFSVKNEGDFNIEFSHDKFNGDLDGIWKVTVLDEYNKEIKSFTSNGLQQDLKEQLNLPIGNYYVKVEPYLRSYSYNAGDPKYYSENVYNQYKIGVYQ
ncbi:MULTISPECIES: Ig-like domain-containing protein [Clostridium]|uniref:Ig-like domain-containing protein n=1 Tax=Clostridium TaxID=1485 RepID=UPI00069E339C|nr:MULTISPECIES: Ig-like domain-containing protein [Clostridium]MCD2348827.1 Ig-like domain-containing protein [Clostridium guangxiense]